MRTITVVPYDEKWPEMFESESILIKKLLGMVAKNVHHIGSTSVPGLSAKPVIDILLEVIDISELDNSVMTRAGYIARGENGISGRKYFIKGGDKRSHQVHAFAAGDTQVLRHLAFRDYLIKNKDIAGNYADIKRKAALLCKNDAHRYSALKEEFIEHHLRLALIGQERKQIRNGPLCQKPAAGSRQPKSEHDNAGLKSLLYSGFFLERNAATFIRLPQVAMLHQRRR